MIKGSVTKNIDKLTLREFTAEAIPDKLIQSMFIIRNPRFRLNAN